MLITILAFLLHDRKFLRMNHFHYIKRNVKRRILLLAGLGKMKFTYIIKKSKDTSMDQRLEMIQKMRNQEATSHYHLNQALQGTPYHSYGMGEKDYIYTPNRTGYRQHEFREYGGKEEGSSFLSFKIRLMLAILCGIFLFSTRTSEKAEFVTEVISHIGENKTIEEVTDQAEGFLKQTKERVQTYLSKTQ